MKNRSFEQLKESTQIIRCISKARLWSEGISMNITNKSFGFLLAGVISFAVLSLGSVPAQAREAPGYVTDSQGNIVRSGTGECWHSSFWTPEMATIVGCDGVVLAHEIDIIEGAPTGLVGGITIPSAALFAFDSDELTEEGKQAIEEYRKNLKPELAQAYAGIIIGHTDNVGNPDYNLGLSKRRADSVREHLIETGVRAEKLRIVGKGLTDPIASNDTPEGRAENRRVEIIVVAELRALDGMRIPSVALFERRSAELTEEGKQLLAKNRQQARELLSRATYVEIVGHTDDVGDEDYNRDLSKARAEAVRNYLVKTGADTVKMVTLGAGESSPVASNATEEGRAENRRVEVRVLGRLR